MKRFISTLFLFCILFIGMRSASAQSGIISFSGGENRNPIDYNSTPSLLNGTKFAAISATTTVTKTFYIYNYSSTETLSINAFTTNGGQSSAFVISEIPAFVSANAFDDFTIQFNPDNTPGDYTTTLHVFSTSRTNNDFLINLNASTRPDDQYVTSFSNPGDQITTNIVTLAATASSELPITFSASAPGHVTDTQLSFTGAGIVTVTVSQAGNAFWNPLSSNYTLSVTKAAQPPITFSPSSPQPYGITNNLLSVSGGSGTGAVHYFVIDGPGKLISLTNGLVMTDAEGTVEMAAFKLSDAMYKTTYSFATVDAQKGTETISFPDETFLISRTNTLHGIASGGTPILYTAITNNPAVILTNGTVFSKSKTSIQIQASTEPSSLYNPASSVTALINFRSAVLSSLYLLLTSVDEPASDGEEPEGE